MANTQLIQEFANYMRNVKNRSECTISAYCSDLAQFCLIMGVSDDFSGITQRDIEGRYIANLVASGISASSRARKLSSLKAFFKWAKANSYVTENPVENVDAPKIEHKEPKVMSKCEIEDLMAVAKSGAETESAMFRDFAIISLLLNTGIRRSELSNIKLEDLDLNGGFIIIHGKGKKERTVYLNPTAISVLSEFVYSHRGMMKKATSSDFLFVSRQGKQISLAQLNNIINKYLEYANLKSKGYTVHSTRKAFATMAFRNTGDIVAVQYALGHSNPSVTMRYIGLDNELRKKAAMSVSF